MSQETTQHQQRTCRREASSSRGSKHLTESRARKVVLKSALSAHLYFTINSPQAGRRGGVLLHWALYGRRLMSSADVLVWQKPMSDWRIHRSREWKKNWNGEKQDSNKDFLPGTPATNRHIGKSFAEQIQSEPYTGLFHIIKNILRFVASCLRPI